MGSPRVGSNPTGVVSRQPALALAISILCSAPWGSLVGGSLMGDLDARPPAGKDLMADLPNTCTFRFSPTTECLPSPLPLPSPWGVARYYVGRGIGTISALRPAGARLLFVLINNLKILISPKSRGPLSGRQAGGRGGLVLGPPLLPLPLSPLLPCPLPSPTPPTALPCPPTGPLPL